MELHNYMYMPVLDHLNVMNPIEMLPRSLGWHNILEGEIYRELESGARETGLWTVLKGCAPLTYWVSSNPIE